MSSTEFASPASEEVRAGAVAAARAAGEPDGLSGETPRPDCFRPRWMDLQDPAERRRAHILDSLGFCGHYLHVHGGGRSGRAPILCTLRKRGNMMPQRELMGKFELKAGSLSEVLTKIEKDGLIERTRDPEDRRQLIVKLTPEGQAQADEEQLRRERFRSLAFATLSDEELAQLEDMLVRIKTQWRTIDD